MRVQISYSIFIFVSKSLMAERAYASPVARAAALTPTSFYIPEPTGLPLMMQWTAPATGIAKRQDAVDVAERFESAYG